MQLCEDGTCGFFFKTLINLHFRANVIFFYSFFRDFKPFCNSTIFFFEMLETIFALIFRMMDKSLLKDLPQKLTIILLIFYDFCKKKIKKQKKKNIVFPKICRQKLMLQLQMTIDSWIFEINTIQATIRLKITQTFRISKNILSLSISHHFTTLNIKIGHF